MGPSFQNLNQTSFLWHKFDWSLLGRRARGGFLTGDATLCPGVKERVHGAKLLLRNCIVMTVYSKLDLSLILAKKFSNDQWSLKNNIIKSCFGLDKIDWITRALMRLMGDKIALLLVFSPFNSYRKLSNRSSLV